MEKGYDVILNLNYRTTVEIETEEKDSEKIKIEALNRFIEDIKGMCGAGNILDDLKAVNVKRNYSECIDNDLKDYEKPKTFIVSLSCRGVTIDHYVDAETEKEAIDHLEDDLTLEFTSEDGNTECQVSHYNIDHVEETDWETEDLKGR